MRRAPCPPRTFRISTRTRRAAICRCFPTAESSGRTRLSAIGWALRPDAVVGRRFHDVLTVPSRIIYETQCAPVLQAGMPFDGVILDLLDVTGEKQTVLISSLWRLDAETGEAFSRLTLMKATDRRRYERQLLASREAAEAEAELSHEREAAASQLLADAREASALREQFVAVLSHDLRNPLASINGAARLLRKQPQTEKALYFLGLMETSVDRMAGLIDNVLDFARGRLGGGLAVDRTTKVLLEPALVQVIAEIRSSFPDRADRSGLCVSRAGECRPGPHP